MCCGRSIKNSASRAFVSPSVSAGAPVGEVMSEDDHKAAVQDEAAPKAPQFGWQQGGVPVQEEPKKLGAYYGNPFPTEEEEKELYNTGAGEDPEAFTPPSEDSSQVVEVAQVPESYQIAGQNEDKSDTSDEPK